MFAENGSLSAGGAFENCHTAVFTAIKVITCIRCLSHTRPAALPLTANMILPYVVLFLLIGQPALIAMVTTVLRVTGAMIFVLLRNYGDFAIPIISQRELILHQQETQRPSDENARLANRDSLTPLPSRRRFFAELQAVLRRAEHASGSGAAAMLDLDRFKAVNDVPLHAAAIIDSSTRWACALRWIISEPVLPVWLGTLPAARQDQNRPQLLQRYRCRSHLADHHQKYHRFVPEARHRLRCRGG